MFSKAARPFRLLLRVPMPQSRYSRGHACRSPFLSHRGIKRAGVARLYGLDAHHDPCRASALAWRTGGDDEIDGLFEFGNPLLALWQPASG